MEKRKEAWGRGAKKDAIYYITGGEVSTEEDFFFALEAKQAEELTRSFFNRMDFDPGDKRMLEIGCGIGGTTRAFADMFSEAYGVDFSAEMIEQAKELSKDKANLFFMTNNGIDLSIFEDNSFDFCFSKAVFGHIPDITIIQTYIREIVRVLKPGGLFKFQVDGRKWGPSKIPIIHRSLYNFLLKVGLVDRFAKLYFRDTIKQKWAGVWLSKARLEKILQQTSLEIVEITGKDTSAMSCSGYKRQ